VLRAAGVRPDGGRVCSIYISSRSVDRRKVNRLLRLRGPDNTNVVQREKLSFMHNLLSMTGDFRIQPFVKDDIVCLYNGEIYNYRAFGEYGSDGDCLIDLYQREGPGFVRRLDGEFAICLCDFRKRLLMMSSDIFRTKPIFYSVADGEFGCSSFRLPLEEAGHRDVRPLPPNTVQVYRLDDLVLMDQFSIYQFDLRQFKDSFEDWDKAFQDAMRKRAAEVREKVFLGLSSGYDSGVICLELLRAGVPFEAYAVFGTECDEVLEQRFKLIEAAPNASYRRLRKTRWNRKLNHRYVRNNTDPFRYTIRSSSSDYTEHIMLTEDNGSTWLSYVCRLGRRNGRRIYLSGMGADEIFSDYGFNGEKKFRHSNFGGLFPDDLSTIFPWNSFYESTMESYLAKEEYVAGSYGLEARYPFLDKAVVQEFLNLTAALKNSAYKSVLHHYLTINNFPFESGAKRGWGF
jgi:asparagine synthetase B (glutamine-hydrolysing)